MRRLITLMLLITLVVPAMLSRPAVAQAEKLLVIGTAENSTSLDPARGFEQTTGIVHKAVYDTLVTFPADNVDKIIPHLAEFLESLRRRQDLHLHAAQGRRFRQRQSCDR